MKLATRYNRANLLTATIILFITGLVYYCAISFILNHQIDKNIKTEEEEIFQSVNEGGKLPEPEMSKGLTEVFSVTPGPLARHYIDTTFYNKKENDSESGRALITSAKVKGVWYKIEVIESKVETEDLIQIIFFITTGITLFLLLALFVVNKFILNRMWQPFYNMLQQLRTFSLAGNNEIEGTSSDIDEFNELNSAMSTMASRVKTDYRELKTFTENASHELLTPIAVINSKLDSLIQTGDYNEEQSKLLNDVYDAVSRLTRLNQSLLLLVKIENRLVADEQEIDLKLLTEQKLTQFKELFNNKDLKLICSLQPKQLRVSKYLIEILLNNLISNAIRHSNAGSDISIALSNESLNISNAGADIALVEGEIYKRFNKSSGSEGTGLGLTIIKQICDNYNYTLKYSYNKPYHTFTILFNN